MPKPKRPLAIDLFCGVGGMSLGFEQAGFDIAGAFDAEERCVTAYNLNFPGNHSHVIDLAAIDGSQLLALSKIKSECLDVLFGGPPCQGFSIGGKRDPNETRNLLIFDFARLVRELQPKYFVLENVGGLLMQHAAPTLDSFLLRVKRAGYAVVEPIVSLLASDYGVPQRRRRTFILGYKKNLRAPTYPAPCGYTDGQGNEYFPTVADAIADLPDLRKHEELFDEDGYNGSLGQPSHYAKCLRCEYKDEPDHSASRDAPKMLTGCLRTRHSAETVVRFRQTKQGEVEPISRYVRLKSNGVAPTIRAGTDRDHGKHTAPRPIHPTQARCITVREAARLHGFPDWFQFHSSRWHSFRQIGNSVPPRLAKLVACQIREAIRS